MELKKKKKRGGRKPVCTIYQLSVVCAHRQIYTKCIGQYATQTKKKKKKRLETQKTQIQKYGYRATVPEIHPFTMALLFIS